MNSLYYKVNHKTFQSNSQKPTFIKVFNLYADKHLKKEVGLITFDCINLSQSDNEQTIKQSCNVSIILNDGTNIMYNYIRDGYRIIETKPTYSNKNISTIIRKYKNNELRKLSFL